MTEEQIRQIVRQEIQAIQDEEEELNQFLANRANIPAKQTKALEAYYQQKFTDKLARVSSARQAVDEVATKWAELGL